MHEYVLIHVYAYMHVYVCIFMYVCVYIHVYGRNEASQGDDLKSIHANEKIAYKTMVRTAFARICFHTRIAWALSMKHTYIHTHTHKLHAVAPVPQFCGEKREQNDQKQKISLGHAA
jgi:hypothetical protein